MSTYRKKDHIRITDPTADRAIRNIEKKSSKQRRTRDEESDVKCIKTTIDGTPVFILYDTSIIK